MAREVRHSTHSATVAHKATGRWTGTLIPESATVATNRPLGPKDDLSVVYFIALKAGAFLFVELILQ